MFNLTEIQRVIRDVKLWTTLQHDNVLAPFGLTTNFSPVISLVTKWMDRGNAHDYVQNASRDPRPLVSDQAPYAMHSNELVTKLIGIARGLYFLHHHDQGPIVHGDLRGVCLSRNWPVPLITCPCDSQTLSFLMMVERFLLTLVSLD